MTKAQILERVSSGNPDKETLKKWIMALPADSAKVVPTKIKVGDVYYSGAFNHPFVIVGKSKDGFLCVLITSQSECEDILCKCESRFYNKSYFTKTLFKVKDPGTTNFRGVYDNTKHLKEVYKKLLIELV